MKIAHWIAASALVLTGTAALADQPNMEAAIAKLQEAKASLEKATADKGGHRVKAIKLVDQAMAEVQAGIEFDRTHDSKNEGKKGEKGEKPAK
jgi:hypothetical protein